MRARPMGQKNGNGKEAEDVRVLAILSSAFSAAVFLACYLLPEGWLLPAGLVLILSGAALALVLRTRPRRRLAALLVCFGAAAGLVWTAA